MEATMRFMYNNREYTLFGRDVYFGSVCVGSLSVTDDVRTPREASLAWARRVENLRHGSESSDVIVLANYRHVQ